MKLKLQTYIGIVAMFALSLVTPVTGYEIKTITESLTSQDFESAINWVVILIATYVGINTVTWIFSRMLLVSANDSINENRLMLTQKVMTLKYSDVENIKSSKLRNIISNDSKVVCKALVDILGKLSSIMKLIVVLIYISILDYKMGLTMISVLVVSSIASYIYFHKVKELNKLRNEYGDQRDQLFNSLTLGFNQWFSNGSMGKIGSKLKSLIGECNKLAEKDVKMDTNIDALLSIIHDMGFAFCIYLTSVGVISGYAEIGTIPLMVSYAGIIFGGFYNMTVISKSYGAYKESKRRVDEVMNLNPMEYGEKSLDFNMIPKIKMVSVSFSYPQIPEVNILKDFNLILEGYGMRSFVSYSGSGKSTIFRLLIRIFDFYEGQILVNDTDIKCLSYDCIKSYFYMINQQPYFTDTTIRENFRLECGDVTDDEILEVMRKFDILEELLDRNQGLDTIIGESGKTLSGGEAQLVTFCKMMLKAKTAKVLLLDEATSALDGKHQKQVLSILRDLAKDHMIIMINHRLSMNVDSTIYFIEDCEHIHIGSHEELMELDSYRELYTNE